MKKITIFILFGLFFMFQSCTVSDENQCLTSFDCPPNQGFSCIDNQCVQNSGNQTDKDSNKIKQDNEQIQEVEENVEQDFITQDTTTSDQDLTTKDEIKVEQDSPATNDNDNLSNQCTDTTCNGHGICYKKNNKPACQCYDEYKGDFCNDCVKGFHKKDSFCVKNEKCNATSCSNHGTCEDSLGYPVCTCEKEYKGENCSECNTGFQDNDTNGTCEKDCSTANLTCTTPKICNDKTGTAICDCKTGFSGTNCADCASGFHKNGSDCVPNVACKPESCQPHGTCDDSSGTIVCHCNDGYEGALCKSCAKGYQDSNSDGFCNEDCDESCGQKSFIYQDSHGKCEYDGAGNANCVCDPGWKSLPDILINPPFIPECSECDSKNPPPDKPNGCDVDCENGVCGDHGNCYIEPSTDKNQCVCDSGYHLDNGDKYSGTCVK